MCRCKFGMFPHITDFINSKDFKIWSGLEHVHKPGALPKLNFLNDDGQVEQSVNIEGWNIDSLKEFLKLKLEF
uniref:Selenoprotein F n=1 Tax=Romanomermis culicivorax TaxID=13658 RepID=A0A915JQS2_ROMCU